MSTGSGSLTTTRPSFPSQHTAEDVFGARDMISQVATHLKTIRSDIRYVRDVFTSLQKLRDDAKLQSLMSRSEQDATAEPWVTADYRAQHSAASERLTLSRSDMATMLGQLGQAGQMGGDATAISGLQYRCKKLQKDQETQQASIDAYRPTEDDRGSVMAADGDVGRDCATASSASKMMKAVKPARLSIDLHTMLKWTPGVVTRRFEAEKSDCGAA